MAAANIVTINNTNFDSEVISSALPVVVDFWASWCSPCRALAPILDELATEYDGKIKVAKVNTDEPELQELAGKYNIRGLPTLLLFKAGQVVGQVIGLRSKRELKTSFDELLAAK